MIFCIRYIQYHRRGSRISRTSVHSITSINFQNRLISREESRRDGCGFHLVVETSTVIGQALRIPNTTSYGTCQKPEIGGFFTIKVLRPHSLLANASRQADDQPRVSARIYCGSTDGQAWPLNEDLVKTRRRRAVHLRMSPCMREHVRRLTIEIVVGVGGYRMRGHVGGSSQCRLFCRDDKGPRNFKEKGQSNQWWKTNHGASCSHVWPLSLRFVGKTL